MGESGLINYYVNAKEVRVEFATFAREEDKMKKGWKVEIAQKPKQTAIFEDKGYAHVNGVAEGAFSSNAYTVTAVMYEETDVLETKVTMGEETDVND